MSRREWGHLCPEGHGLLVPREDWTRQGVIWCPSAEHGGNGRFFRLNEVEEGWFDPTKPTTYSDEYKARMAAAVQRTEEWDAERTRRRKETEKMAKTEKPKATPKAKTPRDCLCGCGGQTKGGRFIPGHDARFHSRVKTLTGQFGLSHDEAEKIASKGPLTGKYAAKPAAEKTAAAPKPEAAKTRPARKPKSPDLTAKASDEPAEEQEPAEDIAL